MICLQVPRVATEYDDRLALVERLLQVGGQTSCGNSIAHDTRRGANCNSNCCRWPTFLPTDPTGRPASWSPRSRIPVPRHAMRRPSARPPPTVDDSRDPTPSVAAAAALPWRKFVARRLENFAQATSRPPSGTDAKNRLRLAFSATSMASGVSYSSAAMNQRSNAVVWSSHHGHRIQRR